MSRFKRPSGPYVISILALVAAIVVPAYAALNKKDKKTVRNIANTEITKRAPGLAVANAQTAQNATNAGTLDGLNSTEFLQVKTRVRVATNQAEQQNYSNDQNLLGLTDLNPGQYAIVAKLQIDRDNATNATINCDLMSDVGPGIIQLDTLSQIHGAAGGPADTLGYTLIAVYTAGAAGTDEVFVRCSSDGGADPNDADEVRIIATLANN